MESNKRRKNLVVFTCQFFFVVLAGVQCEFKQSTDKCNSLGLWRLDQIVDIYQQEFLTNAKSTSELRELVELNEQIVLFKNSLVNTTGGISKDDKGFVGGCQMVSSVEHDLSLVELNEILSQFVLKNANSSNDRVSNVCSYINGSFNLGKGTLFDESYLSEIDVSTLLSEIITLQLVIYM